MTRLRPACLVLLSGLAGCASLAPAEQNAAQLAALKPAAACDARLPFFGYYRYARDEMQQYVAPDARISMGNDGGWCVISYQAQMPNGSPTVADASVTTPPWPWGGDGRDPERPAADRLPARARVHGTGHVHGQPAWPAAIHRAGAGCGGCRDPGRCVLGPLKFGNPDQKSIGAQTARHALKQIPMDCDLAAGDMSGQYRRCQCATRNARI